MSIGSGGAGLWSSSSCCRNLPRLQAVAADEYSIVLRLWRTDRHVCSAEFDTDRFERLRVLADGRLQLQLHGQSRRIMFNVLRSLSQAELRFLVGGPGLDGEALSQILIEATRAIVEYGRWGLAERTPAGRLSRRGWALLRAALGDQPGIPGPLRPPGPGRLVVGEAAGLLAEGCQLQRPHQPGRAVSPEGYHIF